MNQTIITQRKYELKQGSGTLLQCLLVICNDELDCVVRLDEETAIPILDEEVVSAIEDMRRQYRSNRTRSTFHGSVARVNLPGAANSAVVELAVEGDTEPLLNACVAGRRLKITFEEAK